MPPPPPPPPLPPASRGFFGRLFDVSFSGFVTPAVVSVFYVLGMVVIGLAYLAYLVVGFAASPYLGLFILVFGLPVAFLMLIWLRVMLEFYLALVRLSDDVREWREEWQRQRQAV